MAAIATALTLMLAGSTLTAGRVPAPPPTIPTTSSCSKLDDATLATQVTDYLAKTLSADVMGRLQITSKNRVVTLSGGVNFRPTRARAVALAKKVKCVRSVINKIIYAPPFEECSGGFQNCCCPNEGCICARVCPGCDNPPAGKPKP